MKCVINVNYNGLIYETFQSIFCSCAFCKHVPCDKRHYNFLIQEVHTFYMTFYARDKMNWLIYVPP